jgi:hypothetical protein
MKRSQNNKDKIAKTLAIIRKRTVRIITFIAVRRNVSISGATPFVFVCAVNGCYSTFCF